MHKLWITWLGILTGGFAAFGQGQAVRVAATNFLLAPTGLTALAVARVPPTVEVYVFTNLPDGGRGTLWSSWGDGCIASNGHYYTAIGNHLDFAAGLGESRVYDYDPATRTVRLLFNLREHAPDPAIAGGKIHSRIEEGRDGRLYFATFWGKQPKKAGGTNFVGGALFRYDPRTDRTDNLGVPVAGQGLSTSRLDARRLWLYFYAEPSGDLVAYDLEQHAIAFRGGGGTQAGNRNIMLDAEGCAYFSGADGFLWRYSPATNGLTKTRAQLPEAPAGAPRASRHLRASTRAGKDGRLYGFTMPGILFAFDPKTETVEDLGPNFGHGEYTAVVELSPDERFLYYAPGSHGSAVRIGCPVVQYELATRRHKVLAYLNAPLRERFSYHVGGSYNLKITPDGGTLFVTFNGAPLVTGARKTEAFGQPALVALQIPIEER